MNNTKADLPLILADYTEFVKQQQRRFEAIRAQSEIAAGDEILTPEPENPQQAWFSKWEATRPQGQWGRWHISDRDWSPDPVEFSHTKRTKIMNGYANWETWNVALWIQNDETTYKVAQRYDSYDRLIPRLEMMWGQMTPDGARWMDGRIDTAALDEMLADL
jgi:hypothetical protein